MKILHLCYKCEYAGACYKLENGETDVNEHGYVDSCESFEQPKKEVNVKPVENLIPKTYDYQENN